MSTPTPGVVKVGQFSEHSRHVYLPQSQTIDVEYVQLWRVEFEPSYWTSPSYVAATAVDPSGNAIPTLGSALSNLICASIVPTKVDDSPVFHVEVTYRNNLITSQTHVRFGAMKYLESVYYDNANKPIQNSAKDFFNPPLKKDYYLPTLDISFVLTTTPAVSTITGAVGAVNSDTPSITIAGLAQTFAVRTLKLESAPIELSWSNNAPLWKLNFKFLYNPNTFDTKVVDAGFTQLNPTSGQPNVPIFDGNGHPVTQPYPLNGSGAPLASGGTVQYDTFQIESQTAFSPLFAMIP